MNRTLAVGRVPVLVVGLFLGGCGRPADTPPPADSVPPPGTAKTIPMIKADPNPAVVVDGKFGKTTISWDTGNGSPGDVFVAHEGGEEKPFAMKRPKSSQEATWIGKGVYEFRLYAGKERNKPLASVQVTRKPK